MAKMGMRRRALWLLGMSLFAALGNVVHRVRVRGRAARLPAGPVLVVCNHVAMSEPLAFARYLVTVGGRYPHFLAMEEVFRWPVVGRVAGWLRVIPVRRGTAAAGDSLKTAEEVLRTGNVVALYPEGRLTRNSDRSLDSFKTGAARLALAVPEASVLVVAQWGARPGRGRLWLAPFLRTPVRFAMSERVDLARWAGRTDEEAVREVTALLRAVMEELLGEVRR